MKKIKGVIFDMDGLMFDTEKLSSSCWVRVGRENGIPITEEIIDGTRGLDRRKTKLLLEEKFGEGFDFQAFSDKSREYMDEEINAKGMPIKKGLLELLEYLGEKGYRCAVASSTERPRVEFYLKTAGIEDMFYTVVCGNEVSRGKPNPDIFLKAAEKLQLEPDRCIVLEDSKYGIEAAYRAGIPAVMIPDMIMPEAETEAMLFDMKESLLEVIGLLEENRVRC